MMRRGSLLAVAVGVLAFLVLAHPLRADVIHFKDGGTMEGEVTKETEDAVTIKTQSATLTVPTSLIERIEKKKPLAKAYQQKLAVAKTVEDFHALLSWCEEKSLDTKEVRAKLRDAVAARRRAEHPTTYCKVCQAYGDVTCEKCQGTGAVSKLCGACAAEGKTVCDLCAGKGRVGCTRCDSRGKRTVRCSRCKGTGTARCSRCGGAGRVKCRSHKRRFGSSREYLRCPNCGSSGPPGRVTCPKCNNSYYLRTFTCPKCSGRGKVDVTCSSCAGKGTVQCLRCGATGYRSCAQCKGKGEAQATCDSCKGGGLVSCKTCAGRGLITPRAVRTRSR